MFESPFVGVEIHTLNQHSMRTSPSYSLAIQLWKITHVCMICTMFFYLLNMVFNLQIVDVQGTPFFAVEPQETQYRLGHQTVHCDVIVQRW